MKKNNRESEETKEEPKTGVGIPIVEEVKDDKPDTVSSSDHKCTYWWTRPSKNVFKLNQKCEATNGQ